MAYTLGEAAKATGISKAGLSRAIKRGAISAERQENGSYKIDPAELHRVYPPVAEIQPKEATDGRELRAQNTELRARLEVATQRLTDKNEVIDDLRRRLDGSDEERRKVQAQLTALLTDPSQTRPKPRRWVLPVVVIAVAVLVVVLLLVAFGHPVRSSLP
jgi:predicted site-specific integrase-resolvase